VQLFVLVSVMNSIQLKPRLAMQRVGQHEGVPSDYILT